MANVKCIKCGSNISNRSLVCFNCGHPLGRPVQNEAPTNDASDADSIKEVKEELPIYYKARIPYSTELDFVTDVLDKETSTHLSFFMRSEMLSLAERKSVLYNLFYLLPAVIATILTIAYVVMLKDYWALVAIPLYFLVEIKRKGSWFLYLIIPIVCAVSVGYYGTLLVAAFGIFISRLGYNVWYKETLDQASMQLFKDMDLFYKMWFEDRVSVLINKEPAFYSLLTNPIEYGKFINSTKKIKRSRKIGYGTWIAIIIVCVLLMGVYSSYSGYISYYNAYINTNSELENANRSITELESTVEELTKLNSENEKKAKQAKQNATASKYETQYMSFRNGVSNASLNKRFLPEQSIIKMKKGDVYESYIDVSYDVQMQVTAQIQDYQLVSFEGFMENKDTKMYYKIRAISEGITYLKFTNDHNDTVAYVTLVVQ